MTEQEIIRAMGEELFTLAMVFRNCGEDDACVRASVRTVANLASTLAAPVEDVLRHLDTRITENNIPLAVKNREFVTDCFTLFYR